MQITELRIPISCTSMWNENNPVVHRHKAIITFKVTC